MRSMIVRGLLLVVLVGILTMGMCFQVNANRSNVYYLGEVVNAGKDTGFLKKTRLQRKIRTLIGHLGVFQFMVIPVQLQMTKILFF